MPPKKPRGRTAKILAGLAAVAAIGGGTYYWVNRPAPEGPGASGPASAPGREGRGPRGFNPNRAQPVSVAEVRRMDMPVWIGAIGTAVPRSLVTVRSRVDGELLRVHFREGETVKAGQLLAEVDPRPFDVQLAQARGQLARDQALLDNAQADLARYKELWAKDSVARQQLDTQEALVRQYRGTVEADRAQVENAKLQLSYARIAAPAGGRIGLRQVDPGNQVHASDANGIVVIAQVQPMTVVFSVPEGQLSAIRRRMADGDRIPVEAWDREQKNRLAEGRLLTVDNLIDTTTGTVKVKADFANRDETLFPNQFVNARLLAGVRKEALVVPGAAIVQGARGPFVYTVDGDDKVATVPVVPGPVEGGRVAVEGALEPGTRVVLDGGDKLRDGARVEVIVPGAGGAGTGGPGGPGRGKGPGGGTRAPDAAGGQGARREDGEKERRAGQVALAGHAGSPGGSFATVPAIGLKSNVGG